MLQVALHGGHWVVQAEAVEVSSEPSTSRVEPYNWARQWYPVAHIADLEPGRPHPLELLGQRLVVWRDDTAMWRCFLNRCPHRLAPLSGLLQLIPVVWVVSPLSEW